MSEPGKYELNLPINPNPEMVGEDRTVCPNFNTTGF